jgi:hypothetical protein
VNEEGHVTSQRGKAGCSKGEYGKKTHKKRRGNSYQDDLKKENNHI